MTPAPPGSSDRGHAAQVKKVSDEQLLTDVALHLYSLGFNVVPVDVNKKPLGSWSAEKRLDWEELKKHVTRASGIAITGRLLANNEDSGVVIFDIDNPAKGEEVLKQVFGDDWKARLCGQSWSFCGLTGPRPKNKVKCKCEKPGQDCDCVNTETGEIKRLSELTRGMYVVVKVSKSCLPRGTIRSDAIELMVSNYEVVFGKHPAGVYYQPIRFINGRWTPIGIEDVGQGEVINCDELKALITLLKQSTTTHLEELGREDAKTVTELNLPEPTKELSKSAINQVINLVRPLWWLESGEGKHHHDIILYGLSSLMRRAGIKYEVARKVAEAIIETGLQDIADKVGDPPLHVMTRNEERHLRETVDYVYGKPTAKLWGRKSFEEALSPAIQKAIEQGLSFSSPDEWFDAVYGAIFGKKTRRETTEVVTEEVLDEYLPREEGINVPPWAKAFEIPRLEYCLSRPFCSKALVTYTREDSQYVVIAIKSMVRVRDPEGSVDYIPNYSPIALLPRFMAQVYDPFYGDWFFIALHDGKVIAASTDFDNFIEALRNAPGSRSYIIKNEQYLDLIKAILPRVRAVISTGITDDVFVDPYGILDMSDYGVEPLLKAYEWIRRYYPEVNARWAWFNVMATVAKILTPIVRFHNKTFNDLVVYNVGRGGEGKSSLVRYILLPLLGGDGAKENYYIGIDGAVRTEPQLRNLLALNRLPLILDEQNRKNLANNVGIFLSATVGLGMTGIQSTRYGHGIAVKFKNLRGIVVFTNVPFVVFLRDIVSEASDFAVIRRFIEVPWDSEPISQTAFKDPPELRPIYGFVTRLWMKYKSELVKSADLLELIEKLATAIGREYPADSRVDEMVQYTLDVVKELREEKRNERLALTDADALVNRAYEFVANELKGTQLTAVRVLRYILENSQRAGIKLAMPRKREDIDKLKGELNSVIRSLSAVNKDPDADALYQLLDNAYNEGKVLVILYARSPLIPGVPKEFLGAPKNVYAESGAKRFGYAVPLAQLVRVFLTGWGEEEDSETTGETKR